MLNTHRKKCQAETVKKALKSLPESQWHIVNVRSFNVHASLLRMHPSDILDSEEEVEEELVSVNAAYQQPSKVVLWWRATQDPASQIQKEWQQKDAKLLSTKAVWEDIYHEMWKLQESVVLQKTPLNINVDEDNCQSEIKKFNSKAAAATSVSKPVKVPVSACVLEQAAVAN